MRLAATAILVIMNTTRDKEDNALVSLRAQSSSLEKVNFSL